MARRTRQRKRPENERPERSFGVYRVQYGAHGWNDENGTLVVYGPGDEFVADDAGPVSGHDGIVRVRDHEPETETETESETETENSETETGNSETENSETETENSETETENAE